MDVLLQNPVGLPEDIAFARDLLGKRGVPVSILGVWRFSQRGVDISAKTIVWHTYNPLCWPCLVVDHRQKAWKENHLYILTPERIIDVSRDYTIPCSVFEETTGNDYREIVIKRITDMQVNNVGLMRWFSMSVPSLTFSFYTGRIVHAPSTPSASGLHSQVPIAIPEEKTVTMFVDSPDNAYAVFSVLRAHLETRQTAISTQPV